MFWNRAKAACAAAMLSGAAVVPGRALGTPVDLTNPAARTVRIEIDQEQHDYAATGGAYSLPADASFTSDGHVATIAVPGATVETFVNTFFAGAVSAVPGSFSDYVLTIDIVSNAVLSASVSGTLDTIIGNVPLTQTASSTTVAGFTLFPFMGFTFPLFCDSGATCTLVPGAPYDPSTGTANAVGEIVTSVFNTFSPFGDIRLSELPPVGCSTSVDAKDFVPGEAVLLGLDVRSAEAADRAVELKVWVERGDGFRVSAVNVGADGGRTLAAGQDVRFDQTAIFTVDGATALGTWTVGCRVLDPVTGQELATDQDRFAVLTSR